MSGGSYNYLCYKSADELAAHLTELESMAERLATLGYARDAALETERLLAEMRAIDVRLTVTIDRLSDVWRAVEWMDSGDSGAEQVKAALAKYRGGDGQ